MGQNREITGGIHFLKDTVEPVRWGEVRSLDKEVVSPRAHRQEVIVFQAFLKEVVDHVLRPEMQLDRTGVRRAQGLKPGLEVFCGIRNILHDVRREPNRPEAHLLITAQYGQGFVKFLNTIIHPGKDVGMAVSETFKNVGRSESQTLGKRPHIKNLLVQHREC